MHFANKNLQNGFPINKALVENGLTVTFRRTCSLFREELILRFDLKKHNRQGAEFLFTSNMPHW